MPQLPVEFTFANHTRALAESRPNGSIAVHRGPLHYAYDIPRTATALATDPLEPRAVDYQFNAAANTTWQWAIDPATLAFHASPPAGGGLPSPVFDAGVPPVSISVLACQVEWDLAGDTFAAPPPASPSCVGEKTNITLWPYGVRYGHHTKPRACTDHRPNYRQRSSGLESSLCSNLREVE